MKITVLGTGTSQGVPVIGCDCEVCHSENKKDKRLRSSVIVEVVNVNILIDTSPDLRQQMLTNQVERVDAILYTHEHNDHVVGLDDIRPFNFKQGGEMPIYGLKRVLDDIKVKFHYAFTHGAYPGAPRVIDHKIDGKDDFDLMGIKIEPIQINHGSLPILGYKINNFAYLTDVSSIPEDEYDKLKKLDVLIIDALRHQSHHSHLSLQEALSIIDELQPKQAYLTHISHLMGKLDDWEPTLPDNVASAFDGQEIFL